MDTLGAENVLAVVVNSELFSDDEFDKAVDLANGLGANVLGLEMSELADDRIVANNPNSWFYSKKLLYKTIRSAIQKEGFDVLADGMIMDDNTDFRPGLRARDQEGSSVRYNKLNYIKLKYVNLLKTQVFPIGVKLPHVALLQEFLMALS